MSPETDLQEQEGSTSESDLVSALPEALQFEVVSEDDILENEANNPVHENIASTAELSYMLQPQKKNFLFFWPDLIGHCIHKLGLVSGHQSAKVAQMMQQYTSYKSPVKMH